VEECLKQKSAQDERIPLLIQLPRVALLTATTILAAIGDITRFPNAKKLVGYAGLGTRIHDSGMTHSSGRITKAGRKDLRRAMVNAANHAVQDHPHWKAEMERLEPHLGRSKAIVVIARKLLVAVWHVLTKQVAIVLRIHRMWRVRSEPCLSGTYKKPAQGQSAPAFVREQLDRLGIGKDL